MISKEKSYGIQNQAEAGSALEQHLEELRLLGFTILKNVYGEKELEEIRKRLDALLEIQEKEFGRPELEMIHDADLVRAPFAYDDYFMGTAIHPQVLDLVKGIMGNYFVLHLQNGIINKPKIEHHQSSWHRDLPYQDFVISKPLSISALFCIDDFLPETGGTFVLPHSHRMEIMPSKPYVEKHALQVSAPAGSVIVFDSMLHHKAGFNSSGRIRRGINHVFVAGILKQQIDFPAMLKGKFSDDPFLRTFLGYESQVPGSVNLWRERQLKKKK